MSTMEKRSRLQMLEDNKCLNKELYQSGKRGLETYLICRADAQHAINRIRHEK